MDRIWSSQWKESQRGLLVVTDIWTSWAEVIFRVKWRLEIQTNVVILWSALLLVVKCTRVQMYPHFSMRRNEYQNSNTRKVESLYYHWLPWEKISLIKMHMLKHYTYNEVTYNKWKMAPLLFTVKCFHILSFYLKVSSDSCSSSSINDERVFSSCSFCRAKMNSWVIEAQPITESFK